MKTQLKPGEQLTFLFKIIDDAKNVGSYQISNLAFACLLNLALDRDDLKIIWESSDNSLEDEWENVEPYSYYDLVVISDGLRDACIPVPIIRPGYQKSCFLDAKERGNFWERRVHERNVGKCFPRQKEYLEEKLLEVFPDCRELAGRYLDLTQSQEGSC